MSVSVGYVNGFEDFIPRIAVEECQYLLRQQIPLFKNTRPFRKANISQTSYHHSQCARAIGRAACRAKHVVRPSICDN